MGMRYKVQWRKIIAKKIVRVWSTLRNLIAKPNSEPAFVLSEHDCHNGPNDKHKRTNKLHR